MSNVYSSPDAVLEADKKGNKFLALLVGLAVDVGITLLSSFVLGMMISVYLLRRGVAQNQLESQLAKALPEFMNSPVGYVLTALGLFSSLLGGYLCARIANDGEYLLAAILGLVAAAFYLYSDTSYYPDYVSGLLFVANILVIFLGTFLHVRKKS